MSGLLTDGTRLKLQSGVYQIRQYYFLRVPEDAAKTGYQVKTIHDEGNDLITVTDHGVMDRTGYNYSISNTGNLSFGQYKLQASNIDGLFSPGSDLWEHGTTSYVADPAECQIVRYSSIYLTSWTLIDGTYYTGEVDRVEYTHASMSEPKSLTFFCVPKDMEKLTGYTWGIDDYDEYDLSAVGNFSGPLPGDN
jgi:hypothetical protein